jgi:hypothetical protein
MNCKDCKYLLSYYDADGNKCSDTFCSIRRIIPNDSCKLYIPSKLKRFSDWWRKVWKFS